MHTFKVATLLALDHAIYVLNFDKIELGIAANGDWSVYYVVPCRFLDEANFSYRVHDRPEQLRICKHYNPYGCWYKRVLTRPVSDDFLLIDRNRMDFILSRVGFDETGRIQEVPDWAAMTEAFGAERPAGPSLDQIQLAEDPVLTAWKEGVIQGMARNEKRTFSYLEKDDPCEGCAVYCCNILTFPHGRPVSRSNLGFLGFLLGFPGVEIGVSDVDWTIPAPNRGR